MKKNTFLLLTICSYGCASQNQSDQQSLQNSSDFFRIIPQIEQATENIQDQIAEKIIKFVTSAPHALTALLDQTTSSYQTSAYAKFTKPELTQDKN